VVTGVQYENLTLEARGDERRIVIERIAARALSGGTLEGTGTIMPGTHSPVHLDAKLDKLTLARTFGLVIKASGKLALSSGPPDKGLVGTFDVTEGEVELGATGNQKSNLEPIGTLDDLYLTPGKKHAPPEEGLRAFIEVRSPGRFWLRSKDRTINIAGSGNVHVRISPEAGLELTGTTVSRQGTAEFLGKRFEIKQAQAHFTGPPGNPVLDAHGIYAASPWNISVAVTGELAKPRVQFASEPAGLSEEESISVILTGQPGFEKEGGPTPTPGRAVTGAATGLLVGQLKQKFGSKLPFDVITADIATDTTTTATRSPGATYYSSADIAAAEEGRSRVAVGKYVSDRVFIKLGHVFSTSQESPIDELTINYRLSDRWSIQTVQTDVGRSDFEVLWTHNYY
jgi:autotransporter translocation and assembly factor TamB